MDLDVESLRGSLRIRTVRRSGGEDGVTTHDAVIVNDDEDVVVQLKGLRLKGMAPLEDDARFTFTDV